MNKSNLIKVVCMLVLLTVLGANAQAQDWKSILKGVANAVANKEGLTEFNLTGTWSMSSWVSLKATTCSQKPGVKWLPKRLKTK